MREDLGSHLGFLVIVDDLIDELPMAVHGEGKPTNSFFLGVRAPLVADQAELYVIVILAMDLAAHGLHALEEPLRALDDFLMGQRAHALTSAGSYSSSSVTGSVHGAIPAYPMRRASDGSLYFSSSLSLSSSKR